MGGKKWEDGGSVPRSSLNIEFSKTLEREREIKREKGR